MVSINLDDAISEALKGLKEKGLQTPHCLFLLGTGQGSVASSFEILHTLPLHELAGVPAVWHEVELIVANAITPQGTCNLWLLEDAPGSLQFGTGGGPERPAWERAFPVWLAAAAGARTMVHTSAGTSLREHIPVGSLASVSDHINLSGYTPLLGLGPTSLGPLFPDQTRLHHPGLHLRASDHMRAIGQSLGSGVGACLQGPSSITPAEVKWLAGTPADIAIQGCAGPWISAAHAGLALVALTCITDTGQSPMRMQDLLKAAESSAPILEDLLSLLVPDLHQVALEMEFEL
ncbi:MAG: purine-nucleoside phosphorylase [Glaciecola sp.]|jgi:purine-nucleoside phosphorylase